MKKYWSGVHFYLPENVYQSSWPKFRTDSWLGFGSGANVWTYFTYVVLRDLGFPVNLTSKFPTSGIVISHSRYLPRQPAATDETMVICIRADYGRNHAADLHIVQNKVQVINQGREIFEEVFLPGENYYIPYWPQPAIVPREQSRGEGFSNVVYFGAEKNAMDFLRTETWKKKLKDIGIDFKLVVERSLWNNYSEVDAVVALRSRDGDHHLRKPPSKLINAWLAGVPAILSPDSAFGEVGVADKDYLEAINESETLNAIVRLKSDYSLRREIVANGKGKSIGYTEDAIGDKWIDFFENFAFPYYDEWRRRGAVSKVYRKFSRQIRCGLKNI